MTAEIITQTVILLIVLNTCYLIGDYTWLTTPWMLGAKKLGKPLLPIFCHALIHAELMSVALMPFNISNELRIELFLFQLITHFLIDVWKGRMNGWFPILQSPAKVVHWLIFGFDQWSHQMVIIAMVWFIQTKTDITLFFLFKWSFWSTFFLITGIVFWAIILIVVIIIVTLICAIPKNEFDK